MSYGPVPISGDFLLEQEEQRLRFLSQTPKFRTGCGNIDDGVLCGGFEPGNVVGITAEDDQFGLKVGFPEAFCSVCIGARTSGKYQ